MLEQKLERQRTFEKGARSEKYSDPRILDTIETLESLAAYFVTYGQHFEANVIFASLPAIEKRLVARYNGKMR